MSEKLISPTEVYSRPMGPLEEGDQALMDAIKNVRQGKHDSSQSARDISP